HSGHGARSHHAYRPRKQGECCPNGCNQAGISRLDDLRYLGCAEERQGLEEGWKLEPGFCRTAGHRQTV
ncbi:hypothetical protein DXG03_008736, partial [Asterophora parasitica]